MKLQTEREPETWREKRQKDETGPKRINPRELVSGSRAGTMGQ